MDGAGGAPPSGCLVEDRLSTERTSAENPSQVATRDPVQLSLVAHELSQPLTSAKASAMTMQARSGDPSFSQETQEKLLETINRNLDQLRALLVSLRMFSEIEAGELEVTREIVSMRTLFEEARDDFGSPRNKTTIDFECDDDLLVELDLILFRQVLVNLISNASKFCKPGSVIRVSADVEGSSVIVRVVNDGDGFPSDQRKRIFDKSIRLEPGRRGLGFGLYVAREIVIAHGGRIWAESEPGRGAAFSISLPHSANGTPHPRG
jgi:signal transduction histidine kinase